MQTNYSLTNDKLYTKEFLTKKAYKLFITIPHTDLTPAEAMQKFQTYEQITYCKVAQEHHEDGDTHIHIFLSFKQQVKYQSIFNLLKVAMLDKRIGGAINFQVPRNSEDVINYIDKEKNYVEYGTKPKLIGKPTIGQPSRNLQQGALEAIELAQQGNIAEAMQVLIENQPMRIIENYETIQENLKRMNTTRVKYDIPIFTKENTTFKKWQTELIETITTTPKKRQIIWVVGEPESGKTFIHDYLANLDNYKYGLYDAGQCVSYDNVVYGYDEEGIICWDFPLNYDWTTFSTAAGNLIEKFSDFGTTVSSKKYKGSTKSIRGHCLVFSNREPLDNIAHRDIKIIRASRENKNKKEQLVNKVNKINKVNEIIPDNATIVNKVNKVYKDNAANNIKTYNEELQTRLCNFECCQTRLEFLQQNNINPDEQKRIEDRLEILEYEIKNFSTLFQDIATIDNAT